MPEPVKQTLTNQVPGFTPDKVQLNVVPRPEAAPVPIGVENPVGEVGEFISSSNPLPVVDSAVAPFAQPVQIATVPGVPVAVELPQDPVVLARAQLAQAEKDAQGKPDTGKAWGGKLRKFSIGKLLEKFRTSSQIPEGI